MRANYRLNSKLFLNKDHIRSRLCIYDIDTQQTIEQLIDYLKNSITME